MCAGGADLKILLVESRSGSQYNGSFQVIFRQFSHEFNAIEFLGVVAHRDQVCRIIFNDPQSLLFAGCQRDLKPSLSSSSLKEALYFLHHPVRGYFS